MNGTEKLLVIAVLTALLAGRGGYRLLGFEASAIPTVMLIFSGVLLFLSWVSMRKAGAPAFNEGGRRRFTALKMVTVFLAIQIVSALWSPLGFDPSPYILELTAVTGLVIAIGLIAGHLPTQTLSLICKFFVVTGSLYAALGLMSGSAGDRLQVLGSGPNVVVRVLSLAVFSIVYLVASRKWSPWAAILMGPLIAGIVLTQSRGGALAFAMSFLALAALLLTHRESYRPLLLASVSTLATLVLAGVLLPLARTRIGEIIAGRYFELTIVQGYTSGRDVLYERAVDLFLTSPLFGVGLGGFVAQDTRGLYSHNVLLTVATTSGVLGLVLLTLVLFYAGRSMLRKCRVSLDALALLIMTSYLFLASQFSGDLYDARFLWVLLVLSTPICCRAINLDRGGCPGGRPQGVRSTGLKQGVG